MDTPDKAAGLADSQVADAVNKDWLLASARSSQLSTELARCDLLISSLESEAPTPGGLYGATAEGGEQPSAYLRARQLHAPDQDGASSAPPPGEASWLVRHQFRWRHAERAPSQPGAPPAYLGNTYAINGHLYDNISYADTPLLRSLSRKARTPTTPVAAGARCAGKFRLLLACFVLLGITLANYSRNALSLAAVGMIASNVLNTELVRLLASEPAANASAGLHAALDGSCPLAGVDFGALDGAAGVAGLLAAEQSGVGGALLVEAPLPTLERELWPAGRRAQLEGQFRASIGRRVARGELVDWTPGEQGLVSAAGSVGNLLIAIPLTRLGEIYGPKWIIFAAALGATLQAALMPLVAGASVPLVVLFQLVFNGLTYGADCVAYTLFAHWLTPTEMAFFVSCLIICYQLGTMLSSFVTARILAQGLAWAWCFYAPAILCGAWTLVWALVGASEPLASRLVSKAELAFLLRNSKIALALGTAAAAADDDDDDDDAGQRARQPAGARPVSWAKLARDPNIWAIIAVKFTLRWYFSAYLSLMPTYLSSVAHMSVATIGTMSVAQSFIGLLAGLLMGHLTKSLVSRRLCNLSLATTRKCFQSVVNFGLAASLLVFIAYDCDQWVSIVALTLGGFCISFYVAAALQLPLDLSPAHCGLITSITNTLALGQALGAPVSGLILDAGPKERARWRLVWGAAVAMNTASGLVFLKLVDSKPRDYNKDPAGAEPA